MDELVRYVETLCLPLTAEKNLEFSVRVDPGVPETLRTDEHRLQQILRNLLSNAVKFTHDGGIRLHVRMDDPSTVAFDVHDTGIGIPRDKQEQIFRAFEQEDTSTTRKYGGTGLGLTIAERLVALMGGKITVQSEPGRGSIFAFTARFGRQPHPPEETADCPPALLHNLPVLSVDDNATNRRILQEWLRGWQMMPS